MSVGLLKLNPLWATLIEHKYIKGAVTRKPTKKLEVVARWYSLLQHIFIPLLSILTEIKLSRTHHIRP
jgi:hypothetical protein